MNEKEKALISISASIAAGCQPCTAYHVDRAREAGACDRSIALAVETALAIRASATEAMAAWAERCAGHRPELEAEFRSEKRVIAELAAVAAAAAVNSVPDLTARLETAKQAGATEEQIHAAIAIAGAIKRTAGQKVDAVTGGAEGATACGCSR